MRGEWGAEQRPGRCSSACTQGEPSTASGARGARGAQHAHPQQNLSLPGSPRQTIPVEREVFLWGEVGCGMRSRRAPWPTTHWPVAALQKRIPGTAPVEMSLAFDEYGRPFIIIRVRRGIRKRLSSLVIASIPSLPFHRFVLRSAVSWRGWVHACCAAAV